MILTATRLSGLTHEAYGDLAQLMALLADIAACDEYSYAKIRDGDTVLADWHVGDGSITIYAPRVRDVCQYAPQTDVEAGHDPVV